MKTFEVIHKTRGPEMVYEVQAKTEAEARKIADGYARIESPGARFLSIREKVGAA